MKPTKKDLENSEEMAEKERNMNRQIVEESVAKPDPQPCKKCGQIENCVCIEGYVTLSNGMHMKESIEGDDIQDIFISTYNVFKKGLINNKGKLVKVGSDEKGEYFFGANIFFLKKVLGLTLKEYDTSKLYDYLALGLIGFQNQTLTGFIPRQLPAIHTAYSMYRDMINNDLSLNGQVKKIMGQGKGLIKNLIETFKDLKPEQMENLMKNLGEATEKYREVTGVAGTNGDKK